MRGLRWIPGAVIVGAVGLFPAAVPAGDGEATAAGEDPAVPGSAATEAKSEGLEEGGGCRDTPLGEAGLPVPGVPETDYDADEFNGPAYDDWLLGSPFRLVPRPRGRKAPRYPRGLPVEGGFPGRRILLTFDDGPDPDTTPRLLEILAREQVPAVFFLVGGRVAEVPQRRQGRRMVQAILAGGHVVGNHTFSHPHLTSLAEAAWKQQIIRGHDAIRSAAGYAPTLFRAPYGNVNGAIDKYLTYRGYTRVHWTYVADEFRGKSVDVMARGILEQIRERERGGRNVGGVLLLHDNHERSVDTAGLFIRRMKAENCALLDAGDEDIWRFVDFSSFFQPLGAPAPAADAPGLRASHEEVDAARGWCAAHAAELEEIRRIDLLQVDINEDGFGLGGGYGPVEDPDGLESPDPVP